MTIVVNKDKEWNIQTVDTTFCVKFQSSRSIQCNPFGLTKDRDGDREFMKSRSPDKTDTELCCKLNF